MEHEKKSNSYSGKYWFERRETLCFLMIMMEQNVCLKKRLVFFKEKERTLRDGEIFVTLFKRENSF